MKKGAIIGIVLGLGAIGGYFFWKSRKAKKSEAELEPEEKPTEPVVVKTITPTTTTAKTTTVPGQPAVTTTTTTTTPAAAVPAFGKFLTVLNSNGKAVLQGVKATGYKVGDTVNVPSGPYAGTHKLTYVYNGTQAGVAVQNLYLPVPFTSAVSGTVTKASSGTMVAV